MFSLITINELIDHLEEIKDKYGEDLVLTNENEIIQNVNDIIEIDDKLGTINVKNKL